MEIFYISKFNSYPPLYGEQVHVYNVIKELVALGHKIYVCEYEQHPMAEKVSLNSLSSILTNLDAVYIRQTLSNDLDWTNRLVKISRNYKVIWELNLPKYESIFSINNLYNYKSKNIFGAVKKHIIRFKDLLKVHYSWYKKKKQARYVDGIVTVSNVLSKYLKSEFNLPVAVITNGANCNYLFNELTDKLDVLIAGSRLAWIDWDTPIQVVKAFANNKKVHFHIVDFQLDLNYKNVSYYKRMPQDELQKLIARVHVGFVLYKKYDWCPIGFYNSPLKLFEYMGNCKVVIASKMGQIKEVIKDKYNGLLVEPENYKDICEAIEFLLTYPNAYKEIAHNAYNTIKSYYSWKKAAQKTINFITNLKET